MLRHFLALALVAFLPALGHGDGLNDVCKESPDLCTGTLAPHKAAPAAQPPKATAKKRELSTNQVMSTNSKTVKRSAHGPKDGHKRLDELSTTQDNWDDLQSDNQFYEKPAAPKPAPAPARKPASSRGPSSTASRGPASIPSTHAVPAAAVIPPPAKTPPPRASNMTFEAYMMENAINPAMSLKIQDHQKAFADLARPAVITIPGAEPDIVAAPSTTTNTVNGTSTVTPAGVTAGATTTGGQNPISPSVGTPGDMSTGGSGSSYSPSGGSSSSSAGLPIR